MNKKVGENQLSRAIRGDGHHDRCHRRFPRRWHVGESVMDGLPPSCRGGREQAGDSGIRVQIDDGRSGSARRRGFHRSACQQRRVDTRTDVGCGGSVQESTGLGVGLGACLALWSDPQLPFVFNPCTMDLRPFPLSNSTGQGGPAAANSSSGQPRLEFVLQHFKANEVLEMDW